MFIFIYLLIHFYFVIFISFTESAYFDFFPCFSFWIFSHHHRILLHLADTTITLSRVLFDLTVLCLAASHLLLLLKKLLQSSITHHITNLPSNHGSSQQTQYTHYHRGSAHHHHTHDHFTIINPCPLFSMFLPSSPLHASIKQSHHPLQSPLWQHINQLPNPLLYH